MDWATAVMCQTTPILGFQGVGLPSLVSPQHPLGEYGFMNNYTTHHVRAYEAWSRSNGVRRKHENYKSFAYEERARAEVLVALCKTFG